eukprot:514429-Pleurochrysis_carterae.AAC.1
MYGNLRRDHANTRASSTLVELAGTHVGHDDGETRVGDLDPLGPHQAAADARQRDGRQVIERRLLDASKIRLGRSVRTLALFILAELDPSRATGMGQ